MLFNLVGYRVVSYFMETAHAHRVSQQIDANEFEESRLIEIRVPVSLPYQTDWQNFQRKEGSIVVNGIHYNYVMYKLSGGEMIYKCLPDIDKTSIVNARDNFFKLANDLQTEKSGKASPSVSKTFNFEYCSAIKDYSYTRIFTTQIPVKGDFLFLLQDRHLSPAEQPPDFS